jgi:hypothetical protein
MSCDYCHSTSRLLQAAYLLAKKKMAVVDFARGLPSVIDAFDQKDWQQRTGFERCLNKMLPNQQFWWASLDYGSGARLSIFFTDRQVVEAAIAREYPQAIVMQVMES